MKSDDILLSALDASGVSLDEFKNSRKRMACFARMAYVKYRRAMGGKVEEIGAEINRDHSTVSHIESVHDQDVRYCHDYQMFFEKFKKILQWKTATLTTTH